MHQRPSTGRVDCLPNRVDIYVFKYLEYYNIHIECVCVCVSVCVYLCVFLIKTKIKQPKKFAISMSYDILWQI